MAQCSTAAMYFSRMTEEEQIAVNLARVQSTIAQAEQLAGRPSGSVKLLAISKKQSVAKIRAARAAGQREFGENYLQEALSKIAALKDADLCWHFTGVIQSNKARDIAIYFDWVHSIDRISVANHLNRLRPATSPNLDVCIQVNLSREQTKAGCRVEQLAALAEHIEALPRLRLRGLMALPRLSSNRAEQRATFAQFARIFDEMAPRFNHFDTLSAGMSGDFEQAIAEGATIVRIGTALFGPRL